MPQHDQKPAEQIVDILSDAGYAPVLKFSNAVEGVPGFIVMKWVRLDQPSYAAYHVEDNGGHVVFRHEAVKSNDHDLTSPFNAARDAVPAMERLDCQQVIERGADHLPGGKAPELYCRLAALIHQDQNAPFFIRDIDAGHRFTTLSAHAFPLTGACGMSVREQGKNFAKGRVLTMHVPSSDESSIVRLECRDMIQLLDRRGARPQSASCDLDSFVKKNAAGFGHYADTPALTVQSAVLKK